MQTAELAAALRAMNPQLALIEGCYVRLREHDSIGRLKEGFAKRQINNPKQFERDFNRFFILTDFLSHVVEDDKVWTAKDLLTVTVMCAALLRDGLRRNFPDQEFEVEIVGEAGVSDEPLELCVTFSRAT
jgi:hypothetical protein